MLKNYKQGIAPIVIAIIVALLAGGTYVAVKNKGQLKKAEVKEEKKDMAEPTAGKSVSFSLSAQNNSGQNVTTTLSKMGGQTKVVIDIATPAGATGTTTQPAHIHESKCATIGAVKYPLSDVVNGKSETILDISYDALLNAGPLSLNVHRSAAEIKTYVACGDIPMKKDEKTDKEKDKTATSTSNANTGKSTAAEANKSNVVEVNYTAAGFVPKTIEVKAGQTVKFVNKTDDMMSVASNPHPIHTDYPEFDQWKSADKGKKEYSFTFSKIGAWGFHNHADASKTGTVIVKK